MSDSISPNKSGNKLARSFWQLDTYRKALDLAQALYVLSSNFPKEEQYALIDQIRRSSRSVGAQIAEAWAKRRYPKSFITKLIDADAEQMETQHWIAVAVKCGYLEREQGLQLVHDYRNLGNMIGWMIQNPATFCRSANKRPAEKILKEEPTPYRTNRDDDPAHPPIEDNEVYF